MSFQTCMTYFLLWNIKEGRLYCRLKKYSKLFIYFLLYVEFKNTLLLVTSVVDK